jgi:4-diphosphocytidyl-2-C-methyl-D-erythritol kinase
VQVEARAKLNLGLAIGPRRPDGFHELATVFQSVTLADTLVAERAPRGVRLRVRWEESAARGVLGLRARAAVPDGAENLASRAAQHVMRRLGLPGGIRLALVKRIPAQAGLGGGSADAAAALTAVLALHGLRVPLAERLALGAELGADVPFALLGGAALGLGRGEVLTRLRPARSFRAVIAVPRWRVSTARAFREIDRTRYGLTRWGAKLRFARATGRTVVEPARALRLGNTFEGVLGSRKTDFFGLCSRMREAGLRHPRLTGSGSAVFGLLRRSASVPQILGRFEGNETLYVVRSARSGLGIRRSF